MYYNTYGDKDETPGVILIEILSDVHEKLDNACVPYNDFMESNEDPYVTNKKSFLSKIQTITENCSHQIRIY